jgi:Tol biopolymer transport system component
MLYLLAADGSTGRPLLEDLAAHVLPLGWSPDGQNAVYAVWHQVDNLPMDIQAADIGSGHIRTLPGVPSWSPDGKHLNYVAEAFGSAWLARADWEDPRRIADRAWTAWQGGLWSPDSSRLALQLDDSDQPQSTIAIYDLITERLSTLVTASDLTAALSSPGDIFVTDGADPAALDETLLRWLLPFGWSADGRNLLVWAHRSERIAAGRRLSALGVIPADGSTPQALAFLQESFLADAAWSPTNPDRLAFTWLPQVSQEQPPTTYLYDLNLGPLYSGTEGRSATWSPDGAWLAVGGKDRVVIVDQGGHERFTLKPHEGESCSSVVWNPAADLSSVKEKSANELVHTFLRN